MNNLLNILEQLAENPEYCIDMNQLLKNQPIEIKNAFLNNIEARIKAQFPDTMQPDRNKVAQIWVHNKIL